MAHKRRRGGIYSLVGKHVLVPAAEFREHNKPYTFYPGRIVKRDSKPRHMVVRLEDGSRYHWPIERLQLWLDSAAPSAPRPPLRPATSTSSERAASLSDDDACSAEVIAAAETLASLSRQVVAAEGTSSPPPLVPPHHQPLMQATASSQRRYSQLQQQQYQPSSWLQQQQQDEQQPVDYSPTEQLSELGHSIGGGDGGCAESLGVNGGASPSSSSRGLSMRPTASGVESHSKHAGPSPPGVSGTHGHLCDDNRGSGSTASHTTGIPRCLHADVAVPPTMSRLSRLADAAQHFHEDHTPEPRQHTPWCDGPADVASCHAQQVAAAASALYAAHPSLECFLRCLQAVAPSHPWVWDSEQQRAHVAAHPSQG